MLDCQAAYRYFSKKSLPHSDNLTADQIFCCYTVTNLLSAKLMFNVDLHGPFKNVYSFIFFDFFKIYDIFYFRGMIGLQGSNHSKKRQCAKGLPHGWCGKSPTNEKGMKLTSG